MRIASTISLAPIVVENNVLDALHGMVKPDISVSILPSVGRQHGQVDCERSVNNMGCMSDMSHRVGSEF